MAHTTVEFHGVVQPARAVGGTGDIVRPHLLLGITRAAASKFVADELKIASTEDWSESHVIKSGSWDSVATVRARVGCEDWYGLRFPDRLTGYDLRASVIRWLEHHGTEGQSVCEVLQARGWKGVGEAEVFLSHVQAEHPAETFAAMLRVDNRSGAARQLKKRDSLIWVDYFSLRQCRPDFEAIEIMRLIKQIGAVFVGIDTTGTYLARSFCILESFAAVEGSTTLMISVPSGPLAAPICPPCCKSCPRYSHACCEMYPYTVDAAMAEVSRPEDKAKIDQFITESIGFEVVNKTMEREMRRSATTGSWYFLKLCCCCPCMCCSTCLDICGCNYCNFCSWAAG